MHIKDHPKRMKGYFQHGDKVVFTRKSLLSDPPSGVYTINGHGIQGYPHFHVYWIKSEYRNSIGKQYWSVESDQLELYVRKPSIFQRIFNRIYGK